MPQKDFRPHIHTSIFRSRFLRVGQCASGGAHPLLLKMAMAAVRGAMNARQKQADKEREQENVKKKFKDTAGRLDDMQRTQLIADLRKTSEAKYIALIALGK